MSRSLADWLSYLEYIHPKSIELGLTRIAEVRARMGLNPTFPIIVVAGTNGKGSTCALLESILSAAGYKVGCHTSPHLLVYNERVRISQQQVDDGSLCASFEKIEAIRGDVPLTYFEFGVLSAVEIFINQQVDVAILEIGLGGRLDAVNVFDADVSIVTSIDLDHMDYLGDTRELIAREKAGVFRQGKVAICAEPDVPSSLLGYAEEIGAQLWLVNRDFGFEEQKTHVVRTQQAKVPIFSEVALQQAPTQWNFFSPISQRSALPYPALRGGFQLFNASAALAALDALAEQLPVSMGAIRRGLIEVVLSGRFQVIPGKPLLILDVAHNPHAARSLAKNLADAPCEGRTLAVFSMLRDKDIAGVLALLKPQIDLWLIAGLDYPRGMRADALADLLRQQGIEAFMSADCVEDALSLAYEQAVENDRIVVFGSFFTVAKAMASI